LVEQMVENRWRRNRVIRGETSMLVRHQLEFARDQERVRAEEGRSALSTGEARLAQEKGLAALPDSSLKFRFILQCLHAAHRAVESEGFCDAGLKQLEVVYGPDPGMAGATLLGSYRQGQKGVAESSSPPLPEERTSQTDFLALLDSEISNFQTLQEVQAFSQNELSAVIRETLVVLPVDDQKRILPYEASLDRQFERLLKQLELHRERKVAAKERHLRRAEMSRQRAREHPFRKQTHLEKSSEPSGEGTENPD
jgi:hypothetical protein